MAQGVCGPWNGYFGSGENSTKRSGGTGVWLRQKGSGRRKAHVSFVLRKVWSLQSVHESLLSPATKENGKEEAGARWRMEDLERCSSGLQKGGRKSSANRCLWENIHSKSRCHQRTLWEGGLRGKGACRRREARTVLRRTPWTKGNVCGAEQGVSGVVRWSICQLDCRHNQENARRQEISQQYHAASGPWYAKENQGKVWKAQNVARNRAEKGVAGDSGLKGHHSSGLDANKSKLSRDYGRKLRLWSLQHF